MKSILVGALFVFIGVTGLSEIDSNEVARLSAAQLGELIVVWVLCIGGGLAALIKGSVDAWRDARDYLPHSHADLVDKGRNDKNPLARYTEKVAAFAVTASVFGVILIIRLRWELFTNSPVWNTVICVALIVSAIIVGIGFLRRLWGRPLEREAPIADEQPSVNDRARK